MQSQIMTNKQDLDQKLSESIAKMKVLISENELYSAQIRKLQQVII
jgi:hypothetical protein